MTTNRPGGEYTGNKQEQGVVMKERLDLRISLSCEGPWNPGFPKREPGWYLDVRSNEGYDAVI